MPTEKQVKERDSLTRAEAVSEFGPEAGERLYRELAVAGGFGDPAVDINFSSPLDLKGLRIAANDPKASPESRKLSQDALGRVSETLARAGKKEA